MCNTIDTVPKFSTKKWVEVDEYSGGAAKKLDFKHSYYDQICAIIAILTLLSKEKLLLMEHETLKNIIKK